MTLARRRRPVRENMPEVTATARTNLFHTDHSIADVAYPPNVRFVIGLEKAGPTRTGIEFRSRPEKRQATKAARIYTILMVVEKHTAKGGLGAVLEQHLTLLPGETRNYRLALS
jgi:hypothetical protein